MFQPIHAYLLSAILFITTIGGASETRAQSIDGLAPAYLFGMAVGELSEVIDPVHSLQVELGYTFKRLPIYLGFGVAAVNLDRFSNEIEYNDEGNSIQATLKVRHQANVGTLMMRYDLKGKDAFVIPFVLGRIGLIENATRTTITDPYVLATFEQSELYSNVNRHSYVLNYGLGAGLRLDVQKIFKHWTPDSWFLIAEGDFSFAPKSDFAVSVIQPGQAVDTNQSTENSVWIEEEFHAYQKHTLPYTMVSLRLGIYMRLSLARKA